MYYFDNAATTYPKPEEVYSKMDTFYRNHGVNVARGQYKEAAISNNLLTETRNLMLNLFHFNSLYETVFTPSSTIAMNTVLLGQQWNDGDIVYITRFEHNAVLRTLNHIKTFKNIIIKYIEPERDTYEYNLEALKTNLAIDKPKLLILNHASNSFGFIFPIKEVCQIAQLFSIKTVVDMSQTAGLIDYHFDSNIDYLIFAGHKTLYAPLGIAGFILKKTDNLNPLIYGGTGIDSANLNMPETIPEKFEAGSPNILAIAGLNASLKWIQKVGIAKIYNTEKENFSKLYKILLNYDNIKTFIHPKKNQIGIIGSVFDTYSCDNIGIVLNEHDIAVRTGLHCAPESHMFMGTYPAGTVRFSVGYFTTDEDFDHLVNALNIIQENT